MDKVFIKVIGSEYGNIDSVCYLETSTPQALKDILFYANKGIEDIGKRIEYEVM